MLPKTRSTSHSNSRVLIPIEKTKRHTPSSAQHHPFWPRLLIGYLLSVPLVALSIIALKIESYFLPNFSFPDGPFYLAVALVAYMGGLGPAILAMCLSVFTLDYFFLPSQHVFNVTTWIGVVQMLRFMAVGLLIAAIIVQREAALRRATTAEYEQHKRASELEATFEAFADSVFIFDEQANFRRSNKAARQLFPLSDTLPFAECVANLEVYDEQGNPLPLEQLPLSRVLRGEVLTGAEAADVQIVGAQGQRLQVSVIGAPLYDIDDRLSGAVLVLRDVTKRRQLEKRTYQTLSTLLTMAETLVYGNPTQTHPQSAITTAHEVISRLAELAQSALGFQHVSIIQPDAAGVLQPMVFIGFSAEQEQHIRTAALRFRASDAYIHAIMRLRKDDVVFLDTTHPSFRALYDVGIRKPLHVPMVLGEQLVGILALNHGEADHDYTPDEIALAKATAKFIALVIERERLVREQTEARANALSLREAQRQMEEFLGIASHELRTPLTSVKGSIQIADLKLTKLLSQPARPHEEITAALDTLRQLFRRADRQAELLNRLVNDLLDVSRIQANKLHLRLTMCDLAAIVRDAAYEQRQVATSRSIGLHLTAETVLVFADTDRIGQVVTNYLTNALKYSRPECAVEVRLFVEGNTAHVEVCDEGPGLSPEEQERIWERFYQAQGIEVQSGSSVGLGIGLHICHTIITQHHGDIGVQSTPGQGSIFWFTLPLHKVDQSL